MTDRELEILHFMSEVRIASTAQLTEVFFKNVHHSVQYNVLGKLVDKKLLRRKRVSIAPKRNSYVYYVDRLPSKKNMKHDLLVTDFMVKLKQLTEVTSFERTRQVGGIIPDAEVWLKNHGVFVEIQLSNHDTIKKYFNLKHKAHREIPNVLYIVTDKEIQPQKLRDIKVIVDDLNMSRIGEIIYERQYN